METRLFSMPWYARHLETSMDLQQPEADHKCSLSTVNFPWTLSRANGDDETGRFCNLIRLRVQPHMAPLYSGYASGNEPTGFYGPHNNATGMGCLEIFFLFSLTTLDAVLDLR